MPLTPAQNDLVLQIIRPFCPNTEAQQALYNELFMGVKNKANVQFGSGAQTFAVHFKERLEIYGEIRHGVPALWDLLNRVIRGQVGVNIEKQIDSLYEGFFSPTPPAVIAPPSPPPPAPPSPLKPQSERYREAMTLLEAEQYEPALALLEQLAQEGYTPRYVSLAESIARAKRGLEAQAAYSDLEFYLGLRATSHAEKQAAIDKFLTDYPDHGDPKELAKTLVMLEQKRLLAVMLDPQKPPTERAEAGRKINDTGGDPRPGVVDFNWGADYWCKVEKGVFTYQADPKAKIDYDYWVGKYQITYGQWLTFFNDPNGYRNAKWWAGLHKDSQVQQRKGAGEQNWKIANHPAENVSWYDAMAFCNWLNWRRGQGLLTLPNFVPANYEIRLLTEMEWEKAARGVDGREYPWGNGYKVGFANIDETREYNKVGSHYLETTTAVGIYPQGAALCGALDMAGNVDEWCRNEYDIGSISMNMIARRGGSWNGLAVIARAHYSSWAGPNARSIAVGLRLGCSVPIGSELR
jgi:formylglycine-generating enzyme